MNKEQLLQLSNDIKKQELEVFHLRQKISDLKSKRDEERMKLMTKLKERYEETKDASLSNESKRKVVSDGHPDLAPTLNEIYEAELRVAELTIESEANKREFRVWTMFTGGM
jgi:hypothetical protein